MIKRAIVVDKKEVNLTEQERFEADIAEMDAELLSIQRDAMQQGSHLPSDARSQDDANQIHQFGVWSALRDFHAKPKRARKTRK